MTDIPWEKASMIVVLGGFLTLFITGKIVSVHTLRREQKMADRFATLAQTAVQALRELAQMANEQDDEAA